MPQDSFYFFKRNALSSVYIRFKSGGNDLKAIGGVKTFGYNCKM